MSPLYYFQEPLSVPEELDHISLTYIPRGAPANLELFTAKKELVHTEPLPYHEEDLFTREYRFPLPDISVLYGFRFTAADEDELPVIIEAGLAGSRTGVYCTDGVLGVGPGWDAGFIHNSERVFRIKTQETGKIFSLEYVYYPESAEEAAEGLEVQCIRGRGDGDADTGGEPVSSKTWRFFPKRGEHAVYFHCGGNGSTGAEEFVFFLETPQTPFQSLVFKPRGSRAGGAADGQSASGKQDTGGKGAGKTSPLPPLPADPGTILHYPAEKWRKEAYEVFSWNLFPKILIFDTRDYQVQADFFKRLAFFVEKKGYTGQLLPAEKLEKMHGWNAHDYRSIDLAAFFQAARDRRFTLNEREQELRRVLIENGILRFDEELGLYLPVEGGCISISRSSNEALRDLFMVHECVHGIFFSSESYREASFRFWDNLNKQEQAYWELFFSWMSYDTGNLYLTVNELQAYLLQKPVEQAEYYFRNHRAVPAIKEDPEKGPAAADFLAASGEPFKRLAEEARELLYDSTGIWIDRLYCLEEVRSEDTARETASAGE